MNPNGTFDRDLERWLEAEAPRTGPAGLHASTIDRARTIRQRPRWVVAVRGGAFPRDRHATRLIIVLAVTAALLVGLIAGALFVGGRPAVLLSIVPTPTPTPTTTATPTRSPTPSGSPASSPASTPGPLPSGIVGAVTLETITGPELLSGVTYTSRDFAPRVTFKLDAFGVRRVEGKGTDWCPASPTSTRTIVLSWLMGCVSQLWFIHPASVDCGTPTPHPNAATLAAAILANPGLAGTKDLGTLRTSGAVPATLFRGSYEGRVIEVPRSRMLDSKATDPDHCRLLPEPGSSDPTFEVRGDIAMKLILTDVDGQLVVLLVAPAGYDRSSALAAHLRGYDQGVDEIYQPLLRAIYDVTLGS